jgi:DNA-binding CsgD family transcriptional regulator
MSKAIRSSMQHYSFARNDAGIWDAVEGLRTSRSLPDLAGIVSAYAKKKGFEHFGFAYKRRAMAGQGTQLLSVLDLPPAWAARYKDLASGKTSENDDPLIRHVTTIYAPSSWDWHGRVTFTDPKIARSARNLLGVAAENGLRVGVTIPLTCPHASWAYLSMTMSNESSARDLVPELPFALLLAQSTMIAVKRLSSLSAGQIALSEREKEILHWCSIGKTSWTISQILRLSEATVNFHVGNVIRKLGVASRSAACAKAIGLGLVEL